MPRDAYWPVRPEASPASWNLMDDILSTWRLLYSHLSTDEHEYRDHFSLTTRQDPAIVCVRYATTILIIPLGRSEAVLVVAGSPR